ncbi:hypothetical protein [Corynebacterium sp. LK19]|nr:hypothetical protein [Corynebacterium sp. LK19]
MVGNQVGEKSGRGGGASVPFVECVGDDALAGSVVELFGDYVR